MEDYGWVFCQFSEKCIRDRKPYTYANLPICSTGQGAAHKREVDGGSGFVEGVLKALIKQGNVNRF